MSMNKISSNTIKLVLNNSNSLIFSRCLATHWNPKYKKLRAQKWVKVRNTIIMSVINKLLNQLLLNLASITRI
jgi:hypothetical protein